MAKFLARCENQVLCVKPKRVQIIDGIPHPIEGQHIRFDRGEYETKDKQEIGFLRRHRLFGHQIFEEKGNEQEEAI